MAEGMVKWFHRGLGRGVIAPDDGSTVVTVDAAAVRAAGLGPLGRGDRVAYDSVPTVGGVFRATNLREDPLTAVHWIWD